MKTRTKGALTFLITVIFAGAFALTFTACGDDGNGGESFVAVTDIELPEDLKVALGSTVTLNGIVEPADASNKTITWEMKNAYGASVTLDGNTLNIGETSIGSEWGKITLTATISDGFEKDIPFTKDISVWISNYNDQTNKYYLTNHGGTWQDGDNSGTWQWLGHGVNILPVKDLYNITIKKNTKYDITLNANISTNLTNLRFMMVSQPEGENIFYGDDITLGDVTSGNYVKEFSFTTFGDDRFPTNFADIANLRFQADTSPVADENQGKVGAIFSNFSLTIEEVTE